jgi:CHASE2 domain-containing sensor protein
MWDNLRKRLWLRHALLAVAALAASLLAVLSHATGALNGLERQSVDARFSIRGTKAPDPRIVIVAVDLKTLEAINARPPIPRADYARALDGVRAGNPRLIVLDAQLEGKTDPRDDSMVVAAIKRDGPVLLATHEDERGPIPVPAGTSNVPGGVVASASVDPDPGGVLRRMIYRPVALPTLAVRAAELLLGHPVDPSKFPDNHAWVDFRGPPGTFRTVSMADLLAGRVPSSTFTGKTVLIGVTDPAEKDVFLTAASSVPMSGVEFDANALSTILAGFPLGPISGGLEIVLLFVLAGIPALLSVRLPGLYVLAASVGVLLLFLLAAQLAFNSGTIVSMPDPILALLLGTAGAVAADAYVQRRQLRNLQEIFDLLPSPVSDFFISYRRGQSELAANTLREGLVRKFGEGSVFMDTDAIEPGEEWPRRLEEAIAACRAMLVVIGPLWLGTENDDSSRRLSDPGDWVRREIELGLGRSEIAIVPVLHDGARPPDPGSLPPTIRPLCERQSVELTGRELERWIDELASSIHSARVRESQRPTQSVPAAG